MGFILLHSSFYSEFKIQNSPATGYWLPATCYLLLATGYWLPATGYRLLATGYWLPATGYRLLATGYRLPATKMDFSPHCVSFGMAYTLFDSPIPDPCDYIWLFGTF